MNFIHCRSIQGDFIDVPVHSVDMTVKDLKNEIAKYSYEHLNQPILSDLISLALPKEKCGNNVLVKDIGLMPNQVILYQEISIMSPTPNHLYRRPIFNRKPFINPYSCSSDDDYSFEPPQKPPEPKKELGKIKSNRSIKIVKKDESTHSVQPKIAPIPIYQKFTEDVPPELLHDQNPPKEEKNYLSNKFDNEMNMETNSDHNIAQLLEMGYSFESSNIALQQAGNDLDKAIQLLTSDVIYEQPPQRQYSFGSLQSTYDALSSTEKADVLSICEYTENNEFALRAYLDKGKNIDEAITVIVEAMD